jgi:hypothetical protein
LLAAGALLLAIAGPGAAGRAGATGTLKPTFHKLSAGAIASGSTLTFNHDTGSGSNRFLVVSVVSKGESQQAVSVTFDNVPMTALFDFACRNFDLETDIETVTCNFSTWVLVNPHSGTHQVKVTVLGASPRTMAMASSYTGVNQLVAYGPATGGGGSQEASTSTFGSFPITSPGDLVYSATAVGGDLVIVPSAIEGQTRRGAMTAIPPLALAVGDKRATTGIQTAMRWRYTASQVTDIAPSVIAFPIKPAP